MDHTRNNNLLTSRTPTLLSLVLAMACTAPAPRSTDSRADVDTPAPAPQVTNPNDTVAIRLLNEWMGTLYVKCGDSYFTEYDHANEAWPHHEFTQYKNAEWVLFPNIRSFDDTERMNGWEWEGRAYLFKATHVRRTKDDEDGTWGDWVKAEPDSIQYGGQVRARLQPDNTTVYDSVPATFVKKGEQTVSITKRRGVWDIKTWQTLRTEGTIGHVTPKCENIPK